MRPNKKLFFEVVRRVALYCEPHGFVAHPSYAPGWEAANQAYQAELMQTDMSEFIVQLQVTFYPSWSEYRIGANRSKNTFGYRSVKDIPTDAGTWTDTWLYQPFDEFSLSAALPWWNPFARSPFQVSRRKPLNIEKEADKLSAAFERNAHFLFDAIKGEYDGRMVDVRHYEIQRPD